MLKLELLVPTSLGLFISGLTLMSACSDASVTHSPPNPPLIKVTGDDAKQITAKGFEEAVQQAMKHEAEAMARGDTAAQQDWKEIIANLRKAKEGMAASDWKSEAEQNGELEETTNPDGSVTYHWTYGG